LVLWLGWVKHYLPPRRTVRSSSEGDGPLSVMDVGCWLLPATVVGYCPQTPLKGRYGGRAERGMKKVLRGMLTICCSPRTGRDRYPMQVSGPADEDICLWSERKMGEKVENGCYLGLRQTVLVKEFDKSTNR
jgi:hypothetical protein